VGKHANLNAIREALSKPLEGQEPTSEVIMEATSEALQLARDAYDKKDPAAQAEAERVLYVANVANHFAGPMHAVPGIFWQTLTRAKMRLALPAGGGETSQAQMQSQLEAAVAAHDEKAHALVDRIVADPELRALTVFAKNWYVTAHGFTQQLNAMAQRCGGELRKVVLHNLADEVSGTDHEILRARFRERVNASYDPKTAPTDPDLVTGAFGVLNYRTGVNSLNSTAYALGSFYTVEAATPLMCKRLVPGLRKRGFEEAAIETFSLHLEADEDHAAEWMEVINTATLSEADRANVVKGALGQLEARQRWFTEMGKLLYG